MEAKELIIALVRAEEPSPDLDREIAILAGFTPREGPKDGEQFWTTPSGVDMLKLPQFTRFLHDAIELARSLDGSETGGISFETRTASSKIGGDRFLQAPTAALSMCASIVFRIIRLKAE